MKHKVQICIADKNGTKEVLTGSKFILAARKIKRFFKGDYCQVICLKPGTSVSSIEIKEVNEITEAQDGKN